MVAALAALALAAAPPTRDVLPVFLGDRGPVYVDYFREGSLAGTLRVFRAAGTVGDVLPQQLLRDRPVRSSESRLLAPGLYGVPEANGGVCFWPLRGWGYCVSFLRHGSYPFVDARFGAVYGLVSDRAARVEVDGRPVPIGRNGFYARARRVKEVDVVDRDGARHVYTFFPCEVIDGTDFSGERLVERPLDPLPDYCG
jgi:hypothetical protein